MPQQTAARPNGAIASANFPLPRRLPQQRDGSRGPLRSNEEWEEEVRLARNLRVAGVQQPEVHARRLVDLREMDDADYAPASVARQGSAAGAREQLELLARPSPGDSKPPCGSGSEDLDRHAQGD